LRDTGVMSEERRGMPSKLWYRVNEEALKQQLSLRSPLPDTSKDSDFQPNGSQDTDDELNNTTRLAESAILECTNPPIKPEPHQTARLADCANLDCTVPPIKNDNTSSLAEFAGLEWRIPPFNYKETETTTEITQPPPQTPPPDEDCRGGGEVKSISVKAGSECSAPQNENVVQAQEDLIFPKELSGQERQAAQKLVTRCDGGRQEILDVLTAIIRAGEVRKSPLAVLRGIVLRWEAGTFDAAPGLHLAVARRRQAEIQARMRKSPPATSRTNPVTRGARPPPGTFKTLRNALKKSTLTRTEDRGDVPEGGRRLPHTGGMTDD